MKQIYIFLLISLLVTSCTKWGYIDTGVSEGHADKTMYEYFKTDPYNWTLVREMIEKAEIVKMFDGTDPSYDNIMFLGPVDNSVRKWMYDHDYRTVADVPKELCKELILRYVVRKIYQREEVPVGEPEHTGGVDLTAEAGNPIWFYAVHTPYQGDATLMMIQLHLVMQDIGAKAFIASSGIPVKNGVVHSLDDTHWIGDFVKE